MPSFNRKQIQLFLAFTLLWLLVSFLMVAIYFDPRASIGPQVFGCFIFTTLSIPCSWYSATRLVPRYLYQKKIGGFTWRVLLLILINVIVLYMIGANVYHYITGKPVIANIVIFLGIIFVLLFVNLMFTSIACAVKIITDRYGLEKRLDVIEKEKIITELNFLRSQINPHFLFNILNTIYFQIDKSNISARGSVEKFSEMLRYQLYDCNTDKIDIKKEIDYINSYVAMQSQRLEKGTDISFQYKDDLNGFTIAPFMLLTLVENAFKHISHFKDVTENKIHINITKDADVLIVKASNTYEKTEKVIHVQQSGGMGLQNLRRRLELLYPGKAQLSIYNTDIFFESVLNINLS
ncbi:MAG: histidine kinase [Ferruginibacter sp.]